MVVVPAGVKIHGTDAFHRVGRQLKEAGRGDLTREMTREMRVAAEPAKAEMQSTVRGLPTLGGRGGASARAARAGHALRRRKVLTERLRQKAHQGAGLRESAARVTRVSASTTGRSAAVRIRAAASQMPPDQRKLPRYMNRGSWRHPVFARDTKWVTQRVTSDWFDKPAKRHGPRVREEGVKVVIRTINKLGK